MTKTKLLAVCHKADIEIEDHGIPILSISFSYDEGGKQELGGYLLEAAFVMRFMLAVGVNSLSEVEGKSVWIVQDDDGMIAEVHPLHKKNGTPFIIKDWQEWLKASGRKVSAYELRTGKKP